MYLHTYPDHPQLQEDGAYRWRTSTEVSFELENLMLGVKACVVIAIFILAFGLYLSVHFDDWESFGIVALCVVVFMVICGLIFGLIIRSLKHSASEPKEIYTLTETHVQSGSGRATVFFTLNGAKQVIVTKRYIELRGAVKKIRVYVPVQEMSFISSFILERVPGTAQIHYK